MNINRDIVNIIKNYNINKKVKLLDELLNSTKYIRHNLNYYEHNYIYTIGIVRDITYYWYLL